MENVFYIVAVIAYFLFQGYQNFKKEQEKAKKRNPGKPLEEYDIPQEVKSEPLIERETEAIDLKPDYKLSRREIADKERKEELVYEKMEYRSMGDYYNPEKPVIKREPFKSSIKTVTIQNVDEFAEEKHEHADFDLKDAVIKEAILKRPY